VTAPAYTPVTVGQLRQCPETWNFCRFGGAKPLRVAGAGAGGTVYLADDATANMYTAMLSDVEQWPVVPPAQADNARRSRNDRRFRYEPHTPEEIELCQTIPLLHACARAGMSEREIIVALAKETLELRRLLAREVEQRVVPFCVVPAAPARKT
jgi:hypothetical protein